jgi:hypothetical protein
MDSTRQERSATAEQPADSSPVIVRLAETAVERAGRLCTAVSTAPLLEVERGLLHGGRGRAEVEGGRGGGGHGRAERVGVLRRVHGCAGGHGEGRNGTNETPSAPCPTL